MKISRTLYFIPLYHFVAIKIEKIETKFEIIALFTE